MNIFEKSFEGMNPQKSNCEIALVYSPYKIMSKSTTT